MIRRDYHSQHGDASWLLISQVEHARLSGELASAWEAEDLSPRACDGVEITEEITAEILAAIVHHDDGWLAWEAAPKIDPEHGRPYSFLSEMPLGDALAIWERSIAAAHRFGPLAGWMVASHFRELLASSDEIGNLEAAWLQSTDRRRRDWLTQWEQASDDHSPRVAQRALKLLQATDVVSLWLCCECPVAADESAPDREPFVLDWPNANVGPYQFAANHSAVNSADCGDRFANSGWVVSAANWPLTPSALRLTADAWLVPARCYASSEEMANVRRPVKLYWRLVSGS